MLNILFTIILLSFFASVISLALYMNAENKIKSKKILKISIIIFIITFIILNIYIGMSQISIK